MKKRQRKKQKQLQYKQLLGENKQQSFSDFMSNPENVALIRIQLGLK